MKEVKGVFGFMVFRSSLCVSLQISNEQNNFISLFMDLNACDKSKESIRYYKFYIQILDVHI